MTLALRSRLTLVYTAVFGMLLLLFGAVSYRVLAYRLSADVSASLAELTSGLHGYLHVDGGPPVVVFDHDDLAETAFVQEATQYYQVFDAASGQLLVQSESMRPLGLEFTPAEVHALRDGPSDLDIQTDYGRLRLSNTIVSPQPGHSYLLQVGISLNSLDRTLDRFLALLFVILPAGLVVAALTGRSMAGVALAPLTKLADAARAVDVVDLRQRLAVRGTGDELDRVAMAFNETLGRLERAIGEMRQFSAALAHELRTPLAALRGEIEMAMRQPGLREDVARRFVSQLEEIDKLKRLIDQTLALARAEAGEIHLARVAVNLSVLAASIVDQLEAVADARGIELKCRPSESVVVHGDPEWIKRLLLNLVDNAIKFTPAGGTVDVAVAKEGSAATLVVRDTGLGIARQATDRIFERFYRVDQSRSPSVQGAGLGLSLVKWIVDVHGGRIEVDSALGKGSTFTVRLPLTPQLR